MKIVKELSEDRINKIFEEAKSQYDYFTELYSFVFEGMWGKITQIGSHPKVNKKLHSLLFQKAIAFDKIHHPDVLCGGLWMNKGFACADREYTADGGFIEVISDFTVVYIGRVTFKSFNELNDDDREAVREKYKKWRLDDVTFRASEMNPMENDAKEYYEANKESFWR